MCVELLGPSRSPGGFRRHNVLAFDDRLVVTLDNRGYAQRRWAPGLRRDRLRPNAVFPNDPSGHDRGLGECVWAAGVIWLVDF